MTFDINNNVSIPLLSKSSIRTQALEKYVQQWIIFSLNLIKLWQNTQHDTRKIKLKKIRLSNQYEKPLAEKLPRFVDMLFEVKNDTTSQDILFNDNKIIMSFCEEFTTVRLILCAQPFEYSSNSSGYSSVSTMTSITLIDQQQQQTSDFNFTNTEDDKIHQKQTKCNCPSVIDSNGKITNVNIPYINNMNSFDIARKDEVNAFICIQPSMQIQKNNYNSQPLFKLTFDSL